MGGIGKGQVKSKGEISRFILHLEFQTRPQKRIPFRMVDYYLRLYRKFPRHQIRQFVIYLVPRSSLLVQETLFETPNLSHVFEVIRLWEQEPDIFLNTPGLLSLAVLTSHRSHRRRRSE